MKASHLLRFAIPIWILLAVVSCSSSKEVATQAQLQQFNEMITNRTFMIESEWAEPQFTNAMSSIANAGLLPPGSSASRINLIGNSNYFKVMNDSISAYLPYFGERQMGGQYGSGNGIEIEGKAEKVQYTPGKKDSYQLQFSARDKENPTENYQVRIDLFPNNTAYITVLSSQRLSINGIQVETPIEE